MITPEFGWMELDDGFWFANYEGHAVSVTREGYQFQFYGAIHHGEAKGVRQAKYAAETELKRLIRCREIVNQR